MIDVVRAAEVEPVEMLPGVKRRTLSCGKRVMLVQFAFDEGAVVPPHQHPQEQTGYVVKGELEVNYPIARARGLFPKAPVDQPQSVSASADIVKGYVTGFGSNPYQAKAR